jgi:hypothetical protein
MNMKFSQSTHIKPRKENQPSMDWLLSIYRKHDTYDFDKNEPTTMFYQRWFFEKFIKTP